MQCEYSQHHLFIARFWKDGNSGSTTASSCELAVVNCCTSLQGGHIIKYRWGAKWQKFVDALGVRNWFLGLSVQLGLTLAVLRRIALVMVSFARLARLDVVRWVWRADGFGCPSRDMVLGSKLVGFCDSSDVYVVCDGSFFAPWWAWTKNH